MTPLTYWFNSLKLIAQQQQGIFAHCMAIANNLLNEPRNVVALHGDIHHRNILDFGERGWLAIDPKSLLGEQGFEYANLLCNPDLTNIHNPNHFINQLNNIVTLTGVDYIRQLE